MIKVFQIIDQADLYPSNSFLYGIDDSFKPEKHMSKYRHVADLAVDTLNDAFRVGNVGPEEKITRYSDRIHSLSIGDILELDGEKFVVGPAGFDKIEVTNSKRRVQNASL